MKWPGDPNAPEVRGRGAMVVLVDAALGSLARRDEAIKLLAMEGCAGTVVSWTVEKSTWPWREGERLFGATSSVVRTADRKHVDFIRLDGLGDFQIFDTDMSVDQIEALLARGNAPLASQL